MHPDPNMVHCAHIWEAVNNEPLTFASAWDGDGVCDDVVVCVSVRIVTSYLVRSSLCHHQTAVS